MRNEKQRHDRMTLMQPGLSLIVSSSFRKESREWNIHYEAQHFFKFLNFCDKESRFHSDFPDCYSLQLFSTKGHSSEIKLTINFHSNFVYMVVYLKETYIKKKKSKQKKTKNKQTNKKKHRSPYLFRSRRILHLPHIHNS